MAGAAADLGALTMIPDGPLTGLHTEVRAATEDDVDLLVAWHADPEVSRYWDEETYTREQMRAALARPDVDPYIVVSVGEPVGYLQVWFEDETADEAGLDMYLIPAARDRGLGPDAAHAMANWLLGPGGRRRLTVDPYRSNERAIRAWTKVGFRRVGEHDADDEHSEPWLLMILDAPPRDASGVRR